MIVVFDPSTVAVMEPDSQRQKIVEDRGCVELDVHVPNNQQNPGFLDFSIRNPGGSEHVDPPPFEIVQVLGMVHTALAVHLVIVDLDGDLVFESHR